MKKRILALVMGALCLFSGVAVPMAVKADAVTDTLQVCVGYYGMDLTEYVTVGTYHWSELEANLPIYEEAYSYYSSGNRANEYTAVVDAAHGFYISDLLNYSKIYYGDIYNILFYVVDAQGIWTAFDKNSLFKTRYYFDDLPGHRVIQYGTKQQQVQVGEQDIKEQQPVMDETTGEQLLDENGEPVFEEVVVGTEPIYETQEVPDYTKIVGYNFDPAWDDASSVEPMLALEDNWASYNEEFEHIGPDFSYMGTGSRFRLLFGQTSPTESMTRESAKYVSRVYVTLSGSPSIGEMPTEIDGSLGSHEITIPITDVYNSDMRDALSEYLNLNSTNENVLRIDRIEVTKTDYSDVAMVKVAYSVIGEGEASLTASIGDTELKNQSGKTLSELSTVDTKVGSTTGEDSKQEENATDEPGSEEEKPASENPSQQESAETNTDDKKENQVSQGQTQQASDSKKDSDTSETDGTKGQENKGTLSSNLNEGQKLPENKTSKQEVLEAAEVKEVAGQVAGYALSADAAAQLSKLDDVLPQDAKADRNIVEVKADDHSEEKEEEERMLLLLTGLSLLGICIIGAGSGYVVFRIRLKKR